MNFTNAEVNKEFLNSPEPMAERYNQKEIERREEMKRKWLEMFPDDKDIFKN